MPIYEYECTSCGRVEEALQKITEKPLSRCRHCNGKLHKLVSQSSFHLKGSGWYVTDYAGNSGSSSGKAKTETTPSTSDGNPSAKTPASKTSESPS
jgi:putative FmdB family regulatory protein